MSEDDSDPTVTLRNEGNGRLVGGPAHVKARPGDEVAVPERFADHYVTEHAFVRVDSPDSDDSDGETESGSEDVAEAFDAAEFVDRHWQSVVSDVESGMVDHQLGAVRDAEEARDSPRDSVLSALESREPVNESEEA